MLLEWKRLGVDNWFVIDYGYCNEDIHKKAEVLPVEDRLREPRVA